MPRVDPCQDTMGTATTTASHFGWTVARRTGESNPSGCESRPTLGKRAQYPHRECPPKPRSPFQPVSPKSPALVCDGWTSIGKLSQIGTKTKPRLSPGLSVGQECPTHKGSWFGRRPTTDDVSRAVPAKP